MLFRSPVSPAICPMRVAAIQGTLRRINVSGQPRESSNRTGLCLPARRDCAPAWPARSAGRRSGRTGTPSRKRSPLSHATRATASGKRPRVPRLSRQSRRAGNEVRIAGVSRAGGSRAERLPARRDVPRCVLNFEREGSGIRRTPLDDFAGLTYDHLVDQTVFRQGTPGVDRYASHRSSRVCQSGVRNETIRCWPSIAWCRRPACYVG